LCHLAGNLFYYFEKYTHITNSKCYAFASSALLRLFFTSNFKNDDKDLAPPENFFAPPGCVGLATALVFWWSIVLYCVTLLFQDSGQILWSNSKILKEMLLGLNSTSYLNFCFFQYYPSLVKLLIHLVCSWAFLRLPRQQRNNFFHLVLLLFKPALFIDHKDTILPILANFYS